MTSLNPPKAVRTSEPSQAERAAEARIKRLTGCKQKEVRPFLTDEGGQPLLERRQHGFLIFPPGVSVTFLKIEDQGLPSGSAEFGGSQQVESKIGWWLKTLACLCLSCVRRASQSFVRFFIKLKYRAARWAFFGDGVALQYRFISIRHAFCAEKVTRLAFFSALFQRVHEVTGFGFAQFVSIKIGLKCLRLTKRLFEVNELHQKISIRVSRIRYLKAKRREGVFNIRVCSNLRLAEKVSEDIGRLGDLLSGTAGVSSKFYCVLNGLDVDFHGNLSPNSHARVNTTDQLNVKKLRETGRASVFKLSQLDRFVRNHSKGSGVPSVARPDSKEENL